MKKSMFLPIGTILCATLVLLAASFGLKGVAQEKAEEIRLWHMQTILPESESFTEETYTGEDTNIRAVFKAENGYVIETNVYGYADEITMLVGVSNEGRVTGMVVTDMSETVSLGLNALNDHEFLAQFLNTAGEAAIGEGVDAMTGATVTSKAIARSINSAVAFVTGADTDTGATSWGG